MDISLIIPAYNEHESLPELVAWIDRVCREAHLTYEALIIDDGSTDDTWRVIESLSVAYPGAVIGHRLNRNYGKSAALQTGFRRAKGDVIITMDADLQDSPDEIPGLYEMVTQGGLHLVSGWKKRRHDPISKTVPSKLFNWVTRRLSGIPLHDFNCGLKAYQARVVQSLDVYGEMHRYIPVIVKWNGYTRIGERVVEHRARKYGITKFGLERFVFGFLDLLSIMFVSRYKRRPMHFFGSLGLIAMLIGIGIALYLTVQKFIYATFFNELVRNVTDQPIFYMSLTAIIVGSQMFLSGFVAEMITQASSRRHEYVVSESVGGRTPESEVTKETPFRA